MSDTKQTPPAKPEQEETKPHPVDTGAQEEAAKTREESGGYD